MPGEKKQDKAGGGMDLFVRHPFVTRPEQPLNTPGASGKRKKSPASNPGRAGNPYGERAMTAQMLQTFSAALQEMMEQTMAKMRVSMDEMAGEESLPPDIADRACLESGRNFALLMRERDRQTLTAIREALARIESGEYGICEECGEDIASARLTAQPMATLCVHCQSLREDQQRLRACAASGFFQL